jgi:hypothetical protein
MKIDDLKVSLLNQEAADEFEKIIRNIQLIEDELTQVEKISKLTDSISSRLNKLYHEKFPKKCMSCGKVYNSREDFFKDTEALVKQGTTFVLEKVQEYRNCSCGSTLMVMFQDRRDKTEFGDQRRELFNICVEKLKEISNNEKLIMYTVRQIFKQIINKIELDDEK